MLNIHNLKHNKEAFTLVEVMLLLVVLSLVFASSVSLITRKHKLKPRRSVHGQYICFRDPENGLRQVKYSGKSLLQDQSGIDKCTFEAPNNSSYMYIMLVGAGGAGGNANHKPKTSDLYEGPMYIDFLKNITENKYERHYVGSSEVAGITEDDVKNGAKWTYEEKDKEGKVTKKVEVPFSVLAFRRILADNHVKIFAYDYAGGGDNSGGMQYDAFTRNDADGDDKANWYRSICTDIDDSTGEMKSAKECLRILITSIKTSDSDKLKAAKDDISKNKNICVFREPISRNCPYLRKYFKPMIGVTNSGDEGYHSLDCSGRSGQQGALIFTKERDFDTGISYATGERYIDNPISETATNVIDWTYYYLKGYYIHPNTCIVGVSYNDSPQYTPGTFMSFNDDKGSLDLKYYNNGADLVASNQDSDGFIQTQIDNGNNIYGSDWRNFYQRIFKTYPSVENLDYKISTQFGQNVGTTCEKGRGDDKIAGGDGQNGGLPFFSGGQKGVGIKDKTGWHYEAFSSYKGGSTYTDATAGGKGAKGLEIDDNVFDRTDFTLKQTKCPATSEPTSKNRTLDEFSNMGTTNGFFSCVGRVGFSYYNNSITSSSASAGSYYSWSGYTGTKDYTGSDKGYIHLLRINPKNSHYWNGNTTTSTTSANYYYSYKCPAVDDFRVLGDNYIRGVADRDRTNDNSIGLKISHYISRSVLHHGERGAAGESKTLFARSFGSADITMLPGVEGKAKAIVTDENATDEERTASAGNGQSSVFGIGCQTVEGEGDEPKCDYKLVAKGGAGGAGFVEEDPAFTPLSKEDIKGYVKSINNGKATAPDKYSDSYDDGTYEGEDSDFQQIAYLSDFPGIDAETERIIKRLGKGGDGGYVHHKCWLQPQYFKYHYNNWYFGDKGDYGAFDKDDYTFDDWIKEHSDWGVDIPNIEGSYNSDDFEGYTAFTEDIIKKIGVCGADGKEPQDQFDETKGTDGYPGAIVIMW